jgi:hypothetical protein
MRVGDRAHRTRSFDGACNRRLKQTIRLSGSSDRYCIDMAFVLERIIAWLGYLVDR